MNDPSPLPLAYNAVYAQLVPMYNEPHRHYHTMTHIYDLLRRASTIPWVVNARAGLHSPAIHALTQAIWFHDCYYDPYAPPGHNEAASAQIMEEFLPRLASDPFRIRVNEYASEAILATAHHRRDQPTSGMTQVTATLLDLDIAGFAEPFEDTLAVAERIHSEYYKTRYVDFARGRVDFLNDLLAREKLFYTSDFAHLEEAAWDNIMSEVEYHTAQLT